MQPDPTWTLRAVNLDVAPCRWPRGSEAPADDPLALPAALLDALATRGDLAAHPPLTVSIDSSALFDDANKIGLGSSAAVLVALTRLLATSNASDGGAFALIDAAHRQLQKGLGSGVDVAAALHGGLSIFERDPRWPIPRITPIRPPHGLYFGTVFTGASTSTAEYLRRVMAWRARASWEYTAHRDALAGLAGAGVAALVQQDAGEFCRVAAAFADVMAAFGDAAGVDIVSDVHRHLQRLAADCGVAYKPSGAGGRDLGVAFATDRDALTRFVDAAARVEGCRALDLALAPATTVERGQRVEKRPLQW